MRPLKPARLYTRPCFDIVPSLPFGASLPGPVVWIPLKTCFERSPVCGRPHRWGVLCIEDTQNPDGETTQEFFSGPDVGFLGSQPFTPLRFLPNEGQSQNASYRFVRRNASCRSLAPKHPSLDTAA